jgi:hypothetical protein
MNQIKRPIIGPLLPNNQLPPLIGPKLPNLPQKIIGPLLPDHTNKKITINSTSVLTNLVIKKNCVSNGPVPTNGNHIYLSTPLTTGSKLVKSTPSADLNGMKIVLNSKLTQNESKPGFTGINIFSPAKPKLIENGVKMNGSFGQPQLVKSNDTITAPVNGSMPDHIGKMKPFTVNGVTNLVQKPLVPYDSGSDSDDYDSGVVKNDAEKIVSKVTPETSVESKPVLTNGFAVEGTSLNSFGSKVQSWEGASNSVDTEVYENRFLSNKMDRDDLYNADFDQGKVKKVKLHHNQPELERPDKNQFQLVHNNRHKGSSRGSNSSASSNGKGRYPNDRRAMYGLSERHFLNKQRSHGHRPNNGHNRHHPYGRPQFKETWKGGNHRGHNNFSNHNHQH